MAIKKGIKTNYGVVASYHKLAVLNIDFYSQTASCILYGWVDESARQSNFQPLSAITIQWDKSTFPFKDGEDPRSSAYAYIKRSCLQSSDSGEALETNIFAGAEDA